MKVLAVFFCICPLTSTWFSLNYCSPETHKRNLCELESTKERHETVQRTRLKANLETMTVEKRLAFTLALPKGTLQTQALRICHELGDPQTDKLLAEILFSNYFEEKTTQHYEEAVNQLRSMVQKGDSEALIPLVVLYDQINDPRMQATISIAKSLLPEQTEDLLILGQLKGALGQEKEKAAKELLQRELSSPEGKNFLVQYNKYAHLLTGTLPWEHMTYINEAYNWTQPAKKTVSLIAKEIIDESAMLWFQNAVINDFQEETLTQLTKEQRFLMQMYHGHLGNDDARQAAFKLLVSADFSEREAAKKLKIRLANDLIQRRQDREAYQLKTKWLENWEVGLATVLKAQGQDEVLLTYGARMESGHGGPTF